MHQFTDFTQWEKLKAFGILEWIAAKKQSGAIRNIGFSYHGNTGPFLKILEDYQKDRIMTFLDPSNEEQISSLQAQILNN